MGINARVCTGPLHPDYLFEHASYKVLLGDLAGTPEDRNMVLSRLITHLDGNLSVIPSCKCGYIQDYLGLGIGHSICPKCNTPVSDSMIKTMSPVVFFNAPPGGLGLVQPLFLCQFNNVFKDRRFDILLYLLDTTQPDTNEEIKALGLPRGLNNFVTHLPTIMEQLCTTSMFKKKASGKLQQAKDLMRLYDEQKESIHCNYLYVINRALVIINQTALSPQLQPTLMTLINAAISLTGLNVRKGSLRVKLNRVGKALCQLATFYEEYFQSVLGTKQGGIRTQLYNIRATVAQYNACTSLTTNLNHPEELHLPYTSTIHMLYPQIMGKLLREGYTQQQATSYMNTHTYVFSEKLHFYMEEVLGLHTGTYPDFILQRFPTLSRGSAPLAVVYCVKKDVRDKSLSYSILGVKSLNLDFDGDFMVTSPCPPYPEYKRLGMCFNMISTEEVRLISSNLVLSMPVVTNIMNWHQYSKENSHPSPVDVAALYG